MKTFITTTTLLLFLMATISLNAQIQRKRTTVRPKGEIQTVDPSKVNQQVNPPNLQNLNKAREYFSRVKLGTPTQKEGERELTVVNDDFPELNSTKKNERPNNK